MSKLQNKTSQYFKTRSLELYYKEVSKYPVLTQEEELRAAKRWKRMHDRKAFDQMVTANLRFVVKVAQEYRRYGFSLQDLIQEGNLGLVKACEKFDPDKGFRLISYAVWWIRAQIQEYILRNWSLVKIGTTQTERRLFAALQSKQKRLRVLLDTEDTAKRRQLIARQLSTTVDAVRIMEQRLSHRDLSLDSFSTDEDGLSYHERIPSNVALEETIADREEKEKTLEALRSAVGILPERERFIVEARYLTNNPQTLRQLGVMLGVSKERVRQLESRAIERIKMTVLAASKPYSPSDYPT